ncbi:hypothetical protein [Terrabacter sp. 2RAF25]|uniref:hypothetical protein n=1 Tax=Terrabacter sp. 2RAF25 TaxID=3232998 RepID=UPI003F9E746E
MHYVAVELVCEPCARRGVETALGAWGIETHDAEFHANQVYAMGKNAAAQLQELRDEAGDIRRRYQFLCPRCGHAPQRREEKIFWYLAESYVQGAGPLTRRVPL